MTKMKVAASDCCLWLPNLAAYPKERFSSCLMCVSVLQAWKNWSTNHSCTGVSCCHISNNQFWHMEISYPEVESTVDLEVQGPTP